MEGGEKLNGFFHSKIADKDFIMVVDDLNFEKQPAKSPECEKLLFRKAVSVPDYRRAELPRSTETVKELQNKSVFCKKLEDFLKRCHIYCLKSQCTTVRASPKP